jgi:hypothetical protein
MATSDKDNKKDGAAATPAPSGQPSPSAFVAGLSPEERKAFMKLLVDADAPPPPKPIVKKKFRVVATRLGFDGLTLRHPGKKFTFEININDDWPDWVVKEEDYVPAAQGRRRGRGRGRITAHSDPRWCEGRQQRGLHLTALTHRESP